MIRWIRLHKTAITLTSMLVILGIAISQVPVRAFSSVNPYRGGYEMRVHFDRTLSITASRVGDKFVATVADPGPFNLATISGHIRDGSATCARSVPTAPRTAAIRSTPPNCAGRAR